MTKTSAKANPNGAGAPFDNVNGAGPFDNANGAGAPFANVKDGFTKTRLIS
jgi:hypothetical protein